MSRDVMPWRVYQDPSNMVDELRREERYLNEHSAPDCAGCEFTLGRVFGHDVCRINKKRDEDGYCRSMDKKGGKNAADSTGR